MANKFLMVVPDTWVTSVCNMLRVTLLASRILRWLLYFWKICASLLITIFTERSHKVVKESSEIKNGDDRRQVWRVTAALPPVGRRK